MAAFEQMISVNTTHPPAAYIGGKRLLSKAIVGRINAVPHNRYCEPFVGMGGIFFRRKCIPRTEVVNDWSGDVANLFRILQRHYPQLMDVMKYQLTSRREFERLRLTDPATLTDLERAARFIYLQKTGFGGKVVGQTLGVDTGGTARFNFHRLAPILEKVHERMARVVIENLPWQKFIDKYDKIDTLFYLDPPYWGCEDIYGKDMFDRDQFSQLAHCLRTIKGRFILSINDVPDIRQVFSGFSFQQVSLSYSISGGKGMDARELIVSGRDF
ncbi:DNA adenine methylase [Hoeflea sp.]|uniref:DNA adenine methylase n=1 Tax=Hoeflea sp. TaxID=1940281 RepID=UPI003A8DE899